MKNLSCTPELYTGHKVVKGQNDLASQAPDLVLELRNPEIAEKVSVGSQKPCRWICPHGHPDYLMSPAQRKRGQGCPVCKGKKVVEGINDLATLRPDLARQLVDPSLGKKLSLGSSMVKVKWHCPDCNQEYDATVYSRTHAYASGCPVCAGKIVIKGYNDLATTHPELARELADQTLATRLSAGSKKKVDWICPHGHSYRAIVQSRTKKNGTGCPVCSGKQILPGFNDLGTTHPKLADELVDQNERTRLSAGSHKKVEWRCPFCHQIYKTAVYSRTGEKPTACPKCFDTGTSFAEQAIYFFVKRDYPDALSRDRNQIQYNHGRYGKETEGAELDVYIPSLRIAVEYNGIVHGNLKARRKDAERVELCKSKGIRLIRVIDEKVGEKEYEDDIVLKNNYSYKDLEEAIRLVLKKIKGLEEDTECDLDISVKEHEYEIHAGTYMRKLSIADDPLLNSEFDPDLNDGIDPRTIAPYDKKHWTWRCSKCGHIWSTSAAFRSGNNKNGCPHCAEECRKKTRSNRIAYGVLLFENLANGTNTLSFLRRFEGKGTSFMFLDPEQKIALVWSKGNSHMSRRMKRKHDSLRIFNVFEMNGYDHVEFDRNAGIIYIPTGDLSESILEDMYHVLCDIFKIKIQSFNAHMMIETRIVDLLRESPFLSAQSISDLLRVSRPFIEDREKALENAGVIQKQYFNAPYEINMKQWLTYSSNL